MKSLGKIIKEVKQIGRAIRKNSARIAVAVALPFIFSNSVDAGNLRVYNQSDGPVGETVYLQHIEGGTEGYGYGDSTYGNNSNPLKIYSCINDSNHPKLFVDGRDSNSTTTFNLELANSGFSGSTNNCLRFRLYDNLNFEWKNMFLGDANDSNNIVADVKYIIANGGTYPDGTPYGDFQLGTLQGSQTGVYDKRKIIIRDHADLNRDRKINNLDYAILARNWLRTGIVKGSNPNDANDYADIQDIYDVNNIMTSYGDGVVDANDLGEFVAEWCWDADDPNTW